MPHFRPVVAAWEPVGQTPRAALREARIQTHWAAQAVGAVGRASIPALPDDSHTAMSWFEIGRMLAGGPTPEGYLVALLLDEPSLALVGEKGDTIDSLALHGRTLDQALEWLAGSIGSLDAGPPPELRLPEYDMPDHAVRRGKPFALRPVEPCLELARWYANADRVLGVVATRFEGATPVRCWPHHFDLATSIALDRAAPDDETARSIGVGMSPGDDSYDEPYFYVSPWPEPARDELPELEAGAHWHTEGWVGAVLPASRIEGYGRDQANRVIAYLRSALEAARGLLGRG